LGRAVRRLREEGHVVLVDAIRPCRWELASRWGVADTCLPACPPPCPPGCPPNCPPGLPDRTSGSW